MEHITSRKNKILLHLKSLSLAGDYRRQCGEYVCDGETLLREAVAAGAEISCVLWGDGAGIKLSDTIPQYSCPKELMQSVSPLKNSPGPVFSVKIMPPVGAAAVNSALILETVQDPGNVGTVIRTAAAFGIDTVILTGDCADLYSPKTVRATMGAVFRQRVLELGLESVKDYVNQNRLKLYGAALSDTAADIKQTELCRAAVAIGSEGRGLSRELLSICHGQLIIPMEPGSESLNAAVAAAVIMWEMKNRQ